jgi:redox-sensitive bicupin YhaK (pirin superfamily)
MYSEQDMGKPITVAEVEDLGLELSALQYRTVKAGPRRVAVSTRGRRHGPITRLVSPSDIGELIKPFVFLDHAEVPWTPEPLGSIHPHSGIATLTTVLRGGLHYEDTTAKTGQVLAGGLEWMRAGNGVWHDGGALRGEALRAYQLWISLPAAEENAPPESQYIAPEAVQEEGPVRVILGRFGRARSPIRAPEGINYFHVRLNDGQRWRYTPPQGHNVAWLAVDEGQLYAPEAIAAGQLVVFEESAAAIDVQVEGMTSFVFGSAIKHPHPLVLGYYSVHTSPEALVRGEAEIRRIGQRLRAEGRLSRDAAIQRLQTNLNTERDQS